MNNRKEFHFCKSELTTIILLTCIFFQIVLVGSQPNMGIINPDLPLTEEMLIDRLRGNTPNHFISDSTFMIDKSEQKIQEENIDQKINHTLNYDVGSQSGEGGSSVTIRDSFNWTGIESLNTQNSIGAGTIPTSRDDSITISTPISYSKEYSFFNLSSIQSEEDWRLIDDKNATWTKDKTSWNFDYEGAGGASVDYWNTIAISFQIKEDYVNISGIMTNHDGTADLGGPDGEIWIEGNSGGQPDGTNLTEPISLNFGSNWNQYLFSPVVLSKGYYFVVMNDTDTTANSYFTWRVTEDAGTPFGDGTNNTKVVAKYPFYNSNWVEPQSTSYDAPLQIRVQPVEQNSTGQWITKKYNLTNDVKIWYNTTASGGSEVLLDDSDWFEANDSSTHLFKSNTSVSFVLNFVSNYTYSLNPINGVTSYLTQNNTDTFWNVTFSTTDVNNTYNVINRTISISGLQTDWNGWEVYWNDSSSPKYSDLEGDSDINYSNGSSNMVINMSTTWQNQTWNVSFNAPNYLYDFNLSLGGAHLDLPYTAYTMNDYSLDFEVNETGNMTYWIDYPNGSQLLKKDFNGTHTTINDLWDINRTFDNIVDVNGTYDLQAFWNNSDCTKVGTFTRQVEMIVNTTFDYEYEYDDEQVVLNTYLNITVDYNSTHNETGIDYANVSCLVDWGGGTSESVTFNHTTGTHEPYTFSLKANDTVNSAGQSISVTIYAELSGYVSNSTILVFKAVANATLNTDISSDLILEWRENRTIEIEYNETGGSRIPGATVTVNNTAVTNFSSNLYYFEFNTTEYSGVGSYLNLIINASHTNYLTKIWYFNLTITPGLTYITGTYRNDTYQGLVANNSLIDTIQYANSSADNITINFRYFQILTNDNLSTTDLTIESDLLYDDKPEANNTWTFSFDLNTLGLYKINITFSLGNYTDTLFRFSVSIQTASTKIHSDPINNATIYYAEGYNFSVYFNNTDWNENITFNGQGPITINETSKIQFLNRTGDNYWFEFGFNNVTVGTHGMNITFNVTYFEISSIFIRIEVIKSPFVNLTCVDLSSGTFLSNGSSTDPKPYSQNEFDNLTISLSYFENKTDQILNVTMGQITIELDSSIYSYNTTQDTPQVNYNWTFIFNGSAVGTFIINITFSHENYTSLTFTVQYIILAAKTQIHSDPLNNATIYYAEGYNFSVYFNNTDWNENITFNGQGPITINETSKLQFLNRTGDNYRFEFSFSPVIVGTHGMNITFNVTNFEISSIFIRIEVIQSPFVNLTCVDLSSGTFLNNGSSTDPRHYSPNEFDNLTISLSYFENKTNQILNVTMGQISIELDSSIYCYNTTQDTPQVNYNWTFIFNGSILGTFIINITFSQENYSSLTFILRYIIIPANNAISDYDSGTLNNPTEYSNTTVKSGNSIDFWMIWTSEYGESINDTEDGVESSNLTLLIFLNSTENAGIYYHWFRYTAGTTGIDTITLTYNTVNYTSLDITWYFEVVDRELIINGALSTHNNYWISTVGYLQYGDVYYFFIVINDSETGNPVDILSFTGLDVYNVTFANVTSGKHLFSYSAEKLAPLTPTGINILFAKTNYQSASYTISFFVKIAETTIISAPPTINTYYTVDTNFTVVWRTELNPNAPYSSILRVNSTRIVDPLPSNFTAVDNGNYSFSIIANKTGTFDITIHFYSTAFENQSIFISITILPVPTIYSSTSISNNSIIGQVSPFYYSEQFDFNVTWIETLNNTGLQLSPPLLEGNGSSSVDTTSTHPNGTHFFTFSANDLGVYQIIIGFQIINYDSLSFSLYFNISSIPTHIAAGSTPKDTTHQLFFSKNQTVSVIWIENLDSTGILDSNPTITGNGSAHIVLDSNIVDGKHFFTIHSHVLGYYEVSIVLEISNYDSILYQFAFNISKIPTYLAAGSTPADTTHQLYFSENQTVSVIWIESLDFTGVTDLNPIKSGNGSSYVILNANIVEGNHLFTIQPELIGYYQVSMLLEIPNYDSQSYQFSFNVSIMPTLALNITDLEYENTLFVEETLYLNGTGYLNFKNESVPTIDTIMLWMNNTLDNSTQVSIITTGNNFWINFTTEGYQWGTYNLTLQLITYGYQSQSINFTLTLLGREITLTVQLPVETIEQGQSVEITAMLNYAEGSAAGFGSSITLASLSGVDITFYIGLNYQNGTTKYFEETTQTDVLGEASYVIDGEYTQSATGFANITVLADASLSGLASSFSMSTEELARYKITEYLDIFEILIPAAIVLIIVVTIIGSLYAVNRKRKTRSETKLRGEQKVEQSFEDIKSIRLIIARHESGLQFFSEKTIAEMTTDTDALSGMSAAISSFMEEVSGGMSSRSVEERKDEIEIMSREGLHMLIWHGKYSSLIIISEIKLPDYFQERLKGLGKELENKFSDDLQNFYSSDQIPSSVVKKMVRKFIPLHYFSAFILNEGVLTLESIKLSGKHKKMLKDIKNIQFIKAGIQFFFSEQIISQLSKRWKRSEAINFLNKAIDLNLLIEASQEDLLNIKD